MAEAERSLSAARLFRGLDAKAIRRLDTACAWRRAAGGSWILDDQGEGTEVFFVVQGQARVVVAAAGVETLLRVIEAGEYFGELAAIDLQPRSAGILAVTDVVMAIMPAAVFRQAIHDYPSVCDQVLGVLVGQVRMLANRTAELSGLAMKPRLWADLLRLARPSLSEPGMAVVSPPPTHAQFAARISSQRETVTKELGALERGGLILRRPGAIVLLDPDRLRAMVAQASAG